MTAFKEMLCLRRLDDLPRGKEKLSLHSRSIGMFAGGPALERVSASLRSALKLLSRRPITKDVFIGAYFRDYFAPNYLASKLFPNNQIVLIENMLAKMIFFINKKKKNYYIRLKVI